MFPERKGMGIIFLPLRFDTIVGRLRRASARWREMNLRLRYRLIAALCVLVILSPGGGGLGAAVICVGSDGHAGIEGLLDECCLPRQASVQQSGLNVTAFRHTCGDCIDVIVEVPPLSFRPFRLDAPSAAQFGCPACGLLCRCGRAVSIARAESAPPSLSLALLSSVVLLT